jgi:hypothetical protein
MASAAARSFAESRRPRTALWASTGNGSTNSRRRRISDISVGEAPALSSRFSSATTSWYVKPPVSKERRTLANADAGEDVLAAINVASRHPHDHTSVTGCEARFYSCGISWIDGWTFTIRCFGGISAVGIRSAARRQTEYYPEWSGSAKCRAPPSGSREIQPVLRKCHAGRTVLADHPTDSHPAEQRMTCLRSSSDHTFRATPRARGGAPLPRLTSSSRVRHWGRSRRICDSKSPYRQRRWRVPPHLGIPVRPRTGVNDPRRGVVKRLPKFIVRYKLADDSHILRESISHGVCHEAYRVGKRLFGRFEPDDVTCNSQSFGRKWDRFHCLQPTVHIRPSVDPLNVWKALQVDITRRYNQSLLHIFW